MHMFRRRYWAGLAVAGLGLGSVGVLSSCASAAPAQPLIPISVGYAPNAPFTGDNTIAIANYLGLWKKAGLRLVAEPFTVAPIVEVAALESNHLDVLVGGPGAIHLPMIGDARLLGIADISQLDSVIANSSIHSVAQLRGKSVLYGQGTTGEMILDIALQRAGLKLSDVHGINTPDVGSLIAAFVAGDAPAVGTYVPDSTIILAKDPSAHVLFSDKVSYPKWVLPDPMLTSITYAKQHAGALARFMWVYYKALAYTIAHPTRTVQLVAGLEKEPVSYVRTGAPPYVRELEPSQLNRAYTTQLAAKWFSSLATVFEQMGVISPKTLVSPKQYLDFGPAIVAYKQLTKSVFTQSG